MRVIVPGPLGWQSALPLQMTRSPSTELRAIAVFMMMPPDDRPRKKGGSMGATLTEGTAFSAVAPSQRPVCDAHQSKYSETVFRSCPPGPNTWTLNIQPLGQFRPHRGFLLARSTLLSSVARLLHTAREAGQYLRYVGFCWPVRKCLVAIPNARDFAERALRNILDRDWAASVRLDIGGADHLAPLLGLVGDELAEVGGRAGKCAGSEFGNSRLDLKIGKSSVNFLVELEHDFGGYIFRRGDTEPRIGLITRQEFGYGWNVWQIAPTLACR